MKRLILLPIAILTFSCSNTKKPDLPSGEIHITMDPFDLPPTAKLSGIVKEVRIVPLETGPGLLMDYTDKVFVGDEHILVSTEGKSELFHFDMDGNFINKIGNTGKGPGEYQDIREITAFEDSLIVYVSSMGSRKVIKFNFDGTLLHEIPNPAGLGEPKVLDHGRIAYRGYRDFEVRIINTIPGDTLKYINLSENPSSLLPFFSGSPHTGFYYTALGRDTIWRIGQDSMRPVINFDFGKGHLSSSEYINSIRAAGAYPPKKLSIGTQVFYGSGLYHFYLLREKEDDEYSYYHILLNEKTAEQWHFDQSMESDDILFCTSTDFRTVSKNGEWVSVVGAHELIEALPLIRENKDFEYPGDLLEQIESMTVEDNPVLVFYTFK